MLRKLHITAITLVLLFLLCVPLAVFAYAFSALLGGLLLLTPLITLQVLVLKTLQHRLPSVTATVDANSEELNQTHDTTSSAPGSEAYSTAITLQMIG
jgi:hypothetical protein